MSRKPIIMITWGPCIDSKFFTQGMMLSKAFAWAVSNNGGIPLVALDHHGCTPDEYAEMADGLLMPGAMYYNPLKNGTPEQKFEGVSRKEAHLSDLYQAFKKAGKPILGICDGYQKINCEEGGTLMLSIADKWHTTHFLMEHPVLIEEGSWLYAALGGESFVNSYHNFALGEIAPSLKVTARAPEGVPEAIEHKTLPIYGVQFHPERMRGDVVFPVQGGDGDIIMRRFIELCGKRD